MSPARRIGYLVPEFPGQTHAFFWREIAALRGLGVDVCKLSTRPPSSDIVCHDWSKEAMRETTYLFPPKLVDLVRAAAVLLRAGPRRWFECARAIRKAGGATTKDRVRYCALIVLGAELGSILRSNALTHVHVHSCADAAMIAMFASLLTGIPYSLTLHGSLDGYGPAQNVKWKHAAFGTTVTETLRVELLAALKALAPENVDVAAMGVDVAPFARGGTYVPAASRGPVKLVSCGRLHAGKGHDDLIEATALLRSRGIQVTLSILGEGPARAELEARIQARDLSEYVLLTGAVSETLVREALEAAHFFTLASHDEAIGVATMEAMAMGVPVVVTGVGGVAELVRDGVDGVLVRPQHPEDFATAIESLLREPARARALGRAGAARIRERFHSGVSAEVLARRLRDADAQRASPLSAAR